MTAVSIDPREAREQMWRARAALARYVRTHSAATRMMCKDAFDHEAARYALAQKHAHTAHTERVAAYYEVFTRAMAGLAKNYRAGIKQRSVLDDAIARARYRAASLMLWDIYREEKHRLNVAHAAELAAAFDDHERRVDAIDARLTREMVAAMREFSTITSTTTSAAMPAQEN